MPAGSQLRHLPNLLTFLRLGLIPLILWLLWTDAPVQALLLFIVAGASDALDGYLAKRYGWTSTLGGLLDPIADKLLLSGLFVTLTLLGALPMWLVILAVARDLIILAGAAAYHYLIEPLSAEPSLISKLNTVFQLLLVLTVLVDRALLPLPQLLLTGLIAATTLTLLLSGTGYVYNWSVRAYYRSHHRHVE